MTLGLIATRPAVRAGDLAASVERDVAPAKLDVRKLKALGLTISLEVGYRLSPLGPALPRPDVPRPGLLTRRPGRADRATGSCDRAVGRYPVGMALGTEAPDSTSTDTEVDTPTEPVFSITEAALAKVSEIRAAEDDPESLCLWIEVTGANGVDYTYDLSFETIADLEPTDHQEPVGTDLIVAIPAGSVDQLRGATLDLPAAAGQGGLVLRNPNRPNPLAGVDLELTGDLAEKITQLLDQSINPSLASHGGFASLVGVDGSRVFLKMGGGCQGCSMSAATLVEGIQVAIKEALPEVTEIIDATDHSAGENPFYT